MAAAISSSELGGVVAHVVAAVERLVCMRRLLVRCSGLQLRRVKIRVASTAAPLSVADEAAAAAAAVLNPLLSSSWQNFVAAFDLCCTPCPTEPLPNSAALIPAPITPLSPVLVSNGTLEFVDKVEGQPGQEWHVQAGGTTFHVHSSGSS